MGQVFIEHLCICSYAHNVVDYILLHPNMLSIQTRWTNMDGSDATQPLMDDNDNLCRSWLINVLV